MVNNCRLELEDREFLTSLADIPKAFKTFARPASVGVEWHHTENQGSMGSCFPAGTKITMADGSLKNIEDVRFGEYVLSGAGVPRPVVDTMRRSFTGAMITVFAKGWGKMVMTEDHVALVVRDGREQWVQAGDIVETDMLIVSRGVQASPSGSILLSDYLALTNVSDDEGLVSSCGSHPVWNRLELNDQACFAIGLYVAEGSSSYSESGSPCRAIWTLHRDERDLQAAVMRFAKQLGCGAVVKPKSGSQAVNVEIDSVIVADFLKQVCGRFCNHKRVPEFILRGSDAQKLAFLRGYYAGDGSDSKFENGMVAASGNQVRCAQIHAATASRVLAQQVSTLAVSLGMKPGRTITKKRGHQRHHSYQTYLYSVDSGMLMGKEIEPGQSRVLQHTQSGQCRKIRSIVRTEVLQVPVYDFTVAVDHSFVAQGLVVHNCQGNDLSSCLERLEFVANNGNVVQLSRIFAYLATQKIDGLLGADNGSTISGGGKLATTVGCPPESLTGYPSRYPNSSERASILSAANYAAGAKYKAVSLWKVPKDPEEAKNWIGGGGAISIGIRWPGIPSDRVIRSYHGGSGGHAQAILGYDQDSLIAVNSWGDGPYRILNAAWEQMWADSYTAMVGLAGEAEPEPQEVTIHLNW